MEIIQNLCEINASVRHLSSPAVFRKSEVACLAYTGQMVSFSEFEKIETQLEIVMKNFSSEWEKSEGISEISFVLAYLWCGVISIHPFEDGNRRTLEYFIQSNLKKKGYKIQTFSKIRSFLLTSDGRENIKNLYSIFAKSIRPQFKEGVTCLI